MEDFIDLLGVDELADGEMKGVKLDSHLFLVARVSGTFYIADGRCPHLHGNLTKGTLSGTVVRCPLHHSEFDLADGSVVQWTDWSGAALSVAKVVRHPRALRVYDVKVADGRVLVGAQRGPDNG